MSQASGKGEREREREYSHHTVTACGENILFFIIRVMIHWGESSCFMSTQKVYRLQLWRKRGRKRASQSLAAQRVGETIGESDHTFQLLPVIRMKRKSVPRYPTVCTFFHDSVYLSNQRFALPPKFTVLSTGCRRFSVSSLPSCFPFAHSLHLTVNGAVK